MPISLTLTAKTPGSLTLLSHQTVAAVYPSSSLFPSSSLYPGSGLALPTRSSGSLTLTPNS